MDDPTHDRDSAALHAALRRLLAPLVTLAVAKGVTYATLDEWLRAAFVAAASDAHADLPAHRRASRISAATGLHRREVQRLLVRRRASPPASPSRAAEVFAHWRSASDYRDADGTPRALPRTGPAPSFEALSQSITRDIHPRAVLEELLRLELVQHDERHDIVTLTSNAFVPSGDLSRMAAFLADNVGDHLQGAVENVLDGGGRHFEQAVFADGLSQASMTEVRLLVMRQWKSLIDSLVPALERMIERDEAAGDKEGLQRFRLGLYSFAASAHPPSTSDDIDAAGPDAVDTDDTPSLDVSGTRRSPSGVNARPARARRKLPMKGKKP